MGSHIGNKKTVSAIKLHFLHMLYGPQQERNKRNVSFYHDMIYGPLQDAIAMLSTTNFCRRTFTITDWRMWSISNYDGEIIACIYTRRQSLSCRSQIFFSQYFARAQFTSLPTLMCACGFPVIRDVIYSWRCPHATLLASDEIDTQSSAVVYILTLTTVHM